MANVVQLNGQGRADRGFRIEKGKQILMPKPVKMELSPITPKPAEKVVQTIRVAQRESVKIKVAAYCRVSTLLESQESSIAAQRTHYHDYICANSEWELAGVYLEAGVSGTKAEARPELQRMMADCRAGKIQLILTKSISRFARNTFDCLEMVRDLVALGVNIRFEKEKIDTGTMGSELMLSILACLAEDESRSISGNMKWGIRKRFENGSFILSSEPYGYRKDGDELVIVPEEAEVVKDIFNDVLSGRGMHAIARKLNAMGVPSKRGAGWTQSAIRRMIHNPVYVGDMLYQKTYMDDDYIQKANKGELDQYYETDHHEHIVTREVFEMAAFSSHQRGMECGTYSREENSEQAARRLNRYALTGKLICAECGGRMHRQATKKRIIYQCQNKYIGEGSCKQATELETSIKNAFITCLNKLAFSQGLAAKNRIIDNYIGRVRDAEQRKNAARIAEIDDALGRNRLELNTLTAIALIDHFNAEQRGRKTELIREAEELQREKEMLLSQTLQAGHAKFLKSFVAHWRITDCTEDFPEEAFSKLVEKAVVQARESITFHFICGLRITETLKG